MIVTVNSYASAGYAIFSDVHLIVAYSETKDFINGRINKRTLLMGTLAVTL